MDNKELWTNCLVTIENSVSAANFNTWFRQTCILKEENGVFYIGVPNEFAREWLKNHFHTLIIKSIANICNNMRAVEYIIMKFPQEKKETHTKERATAGNNATNKELPLRGLYINPEDNLNSKYTFDSFVVGAFNELAYAAAQGIIESPGTKYNPFFVYGGSGLGKTHLIQGIGNTIKEKYPDKKVHYITLEKFATDYVNHLKSKSANYFKEKYRKNDVLIIDDIQFINKMEKIKEEMFHTFNSFHQNNKQIIFSCDKHPNYIVGLEDRLRTRFSSGMVIDISVPEYESRLAILKAKTKEHNMDIGDSILEYIASSVNSSIRDLEGSLNSIMINCQLKNRNVSIIEAREIIKDNIKPKKNMPVNEVINIISNYYNFKDSMIYEKSRRKEIVKARQIIMFLLREDFDMSYSLIGQKVGGKDHTTVIHSCEKIKEVLKTDNSLSQEIEQIRSILR